MRNKLDLIWFEGVVFLDMNKASFTKSQLSMESVPNSWKILLLVTVQCSPIITAIFKYSH